VWVNNLAIAKVGEGPLPRLLPSGDSQADGSQLDRLPDFVVPELEHPDECQEAFALPEPFFSPPELFFGVPSPPLVHPDELGIDEFKY
jgi:hypothetical protein